MRSRSSCLSFHRVDGLKQLKGGSVTGPLGPSMLQALSSIPTTAKNNTKKPEAILSQMQKFKSKILDEPSLLGENPCCVQLPVAQVPLATAAHCSLCICLQVPFFFVCLSLSFITQRHRALDFACTPNPCRLPPEILALRSWHIWSLSF